MQEKHSRIINFLFGPMLAVIGFFVRHYSANRERLDNWLSVKKVGDFFRLLAVTILAIWLFVFAFSSETNRKKLTDEVKRNFFTEDKQSPMAPPVSRPEAGQ